MDTRRTTGELYTLAVDERNEKTDFELTNLKEIDMHLAELFSFAWSNLLAWIGSATVPSTPSLRCGTLRMTSLWSVLEGARCRVTMGRGEDMLSVHETMDNYAAGWVS